MPQKFQIHERQSEVALGDPPQFYRSSQAVDFNNLTRKRQTCLFPALTLRTAMPGEGCAGDRLDSRVSGQVTALSAGIAVTPH